MNKYFCCQMIAVAVNEKLAEIPVEYMLTVLFIVGDVLFYFVLPIFNEW